MRRGGWIIATLMASWLGAGGCDEPPALEQAQLPARAVRFIVDEPGLLYVFDDLTRGKTAVRTLSQIPSKRRAAVLIQRPAMPEVVGQGAYMADLSEASAGQSASAKLVSRRHVISSGFACEWADELAQGVVVMARGLTESAPGGERERRARELLMRFDTLVQPPPKPLRRAAPPQAPLEAPTQPAP